MPFEAPTSLVQLVCARAVERPDDLAYTFLDEGEREGRSLTYGELARRAKAVGAALHERGAAGRCVLLLYPPGLEFVVAFFGCLFAGAVAVPAYPPRSKKSLPRLRAIAADALPAAVLTDAANLAKFSTIAGLDPELQAIANWIASDQVPDSAADGWRDPGASPDTLAFLQYTSGSTSTPKGVMVCHGNLLANEEMIRRAFGQSEASVIVGWLPLYHDMGLIGNVLQPLYVGGRCILMSPLDFLQRPRRWLEAIASYRATTSGGPNFAYELCVHKLPPAEREGLDLASWQVAFNGAEPVRASTLRNFAQAYAAQGFRAEAFLPCYGLAEATLLVTAKELGAPVAIGEFDPAALEEGRVEPAKAPGQGGKGRALVGCGRPAAGLRLAIADPETGRRAEAGRVGEVWVSGPSIALGYWRRPEPTAETFAAELVDEPGTRYLRTGDLGFIAGDELYVTGRLKDLVILRGRNHYPQDLELTAEQSHPDLRPGCTAAFSVETEGQEQLVVVQEVRRGAQAPPAEMAEAVRRAIVEHHEVETWAVVLVPPGTVPKTSSGKIQRRACRQAWLEGTLPRLFESSADNSGYQPSAAIAAPSRAELVAAASAARRRPILDFVRLEAARLLKVPAEALEEEEPLALDSLAAMELKSRLEGLLEVSLPLALFFEAPSLGQVAAAAVAALDAAPLDGPPLDGAPLGPSPAAASAAEPFPLSRGQEALWFLEQLEPSSGAYHVSFAARLPAGLDARWLERAFGQLVARHGSLRTVFLATAAGPRQQVRRELAPVLERVAAGSWSESELPALLAASAARPFDLANGPPLRLTSFEGPRGHVLLCVAHHLVVDLWSLVVLAEELGQVLPALAASRKLELAAPRASYADFVSTQRRELGGARGEELWSFWRAELAGAPTALPLPTDRPRHGADRDGGSGRAESRGAAGSAKLTLSPATTAELQRLANRAGASVYTLLLAAFQALLAKLTGERDLLVGSPVAGRTRAGFEEVVGFFVDTLVLRARLGRDPSFEAHLERTRRTVVGALAHQDFPYPLLVERLRPVREDGRSPLVQVLFALERPHRLAEDGLAHFVLGEGGGMLSLGGVELEAVAVPRRGVQFDLEMVMAEVDGRFAGVLHFARDLWDEASARNLVGRFERLLGAVVASPRAPLSQLSPLFPAEREQLWSTWARPGLGAAGPSPETLLLAFAGRVAADPEAPALCWEESPASPPQVWTYAELAGRAERLARVLVAHGVGPETLVAVALPRSMEVPLAFLAILRAGGVYLPLDPAYPVDRLHFMLSDSGAVLLLSRRALAQELGLHEAGVRLLLLDELEGQPEATPPRLRELAPQAAAYAIYTSGSTGRPKGVVLTHRGLGNLARVQARAFGVGPGSRVLQFAALSFDAAVSEMAMAFSAGGALCLAGAAERLPGPPLVALLERLRITHVTLPPSALAALPVAALPDLVTLISAGEALPQALVDRWGRDRRLVNAYGPTETTVCATLGVVAPGQARPSIGKPLPGASCHVLDPGLGLVPTGSPGELAVGGLGVARGYLSRPQASAERFVPDPFSHEPGARLYLTGDRVRWTAAGELDFLGRRDAQVKVRGFRVEPAEVEAALGRQPGVQAAAVVARFDVPGGRLVGWFVPAAGAAIDAAGLRAALAAELPDHLVPALLLPIAELPISPAGKVDHRALATKPLELAGQGPRGAGSGASELEAAVAALWREALGLPEVGLDDNFFDLGGHSLLVAHLHPRLRALFGRELSMVDLFRFPTVRSLVRFVMVDERSDAGEAAPAASRAAARRAAVAGDSRGAIAVVGLACRFPGAPNAASLWANLKAGKEAVEPLSPADLEAAGVDAALAADPAYVASAVPLADVDRFDAGYFGFNPREAETLDPQHRFFLECAVEALEDAGLDPDTFAGTVGVFGGSGFESYLHGQLGGGGVSPAAGYQLTVGNLKDFLATRVAYELDLEGPAITVQTACSTSLVAAHLACQSLLLRECDAALAGGVSIEIPQRAGYLYQEGMILSPDGHCRPFDAAARGTVRGSGVGLVVLKRLEDALAAGDHVRAVIKASALNNDGADKVGYTAPSVDRQAAVIAEALALAGVDAATIGYVEAHGTGTELGDPIEIAALGTAFHRAAAAPLAPGSCAIGSIKSNFGHLDAAAGVAGLIKAVLAVEHGELPPSLNFEAPNPGIDFAASPFRVNTELRPWPGSPEQPRRAGVSSFGIGGTNAHVVLEQAPEVAAPPPAEGPQLLVLSARSESSLEAGRQRLADHLRAASGLDLADVAFTLQTGRRALEHRLVLLAQGVADAAEALASADPERLLGARRPDSPPAIAFLFPGQGAQHPGMARELYEWAPVFRAELDRCAAGLQLHLGCDLLAALYPAAQPPPAEQDDEAARNLTATWLAQPALFAVEYALARQWMAWGVRPAAMLGHSIGEWVAACLADVVSLPDALRLVAARGRLMQAMAPGAMVSVALPADGIADRLPPGLELAALNGPSAVVVSGPEPAIADLAAELGREGVSCRLLHTSHAFHSAAMEPAAERFKALVAEVALGTPRLPFLSNLTGTWITAEQATDPGYWAEQLRRPVRFAAGLGALLDDPRRLLLEVGPGQSLSSLARQHPGRAASQPVFASLPHPREPIAADVAMAGAVGRLWLAGAEIAWRAMHGEARRRKLNLPTYAFEDRRFWARSGRRGGQQTTRPAGRQALADWFWVPGWRAAARPLAPVVGDGEPWLILLDARGVGAAIARELAAAGAALTLVSPGEALRGTTPGHFELRPAERDDWSALLERLATAGAVPRHVLHLGLLDGAAEGLDGAAALARGHGSVLALGQALGARPESHGLALTVVAEGLVGVAGGERLVPEKAAVIGPVRVLPQELPHLSCRAVDVQVPASGPALVHLARQLLAEAGATDAERLVAWRGRQRLVRSYAAVPLPPAAAGAPALRDRGVYLLSGGFGGLGGAVARFLAERFAARLVLTSRGPWPDREAWPALLATADPLAPRLRFVAELEAAGAEVLVLEADAGNAAAVAAAVARAQRHFGRIDGVFHAAGQPGGGVIQGRDAQAAAAVLAPKVEGARALVAALAGSSPDFVVFFSSLAASLGGFGQADYSAANNVLEAWADSLAAARPETYWCAVGWGAWEEVGMASRGPAAALRRLEAGGGEGAGDGIAPADGIEALVRLLAGEPGSRVLVSPRDLPSLVAAYGRELDLEQLSAELAGAATAGPRHPRPALQTRFIAPGSELERELAEIWQDQLALESVGILDNFFELGGTSLLGIQVMAEIRRKLGVEMPAVALYEGSTVKALAELVERARGDAPKVGEDQPERDKGRNRGALRREMARRRRGSTDDS